MGGGEGGGGRSWDVVRSKEDGEKREVVVWLWYGATKCALSLAEPERRRPERWGERKRERESSAAAALAAAPCSVLCLGADVTGWAGRVLDQIGAVAG